VPIISVLVVLIVIGVLLWCITLLPMDPTIAQIIRVLVLIATVLWLLSVFGLLPGDLRVRAG
jgi:hypothetical protein